MRTKSSKRITNVTEKPPPILLAPESSPNHNGTSRCNDSFILVMGHSGNENKNFVSNISANPHYQTALSRGCPELIATSGFDYLYAGSKSDVDIFSEIVGEVLHRKGNQSISGVIIIYPSEDRYYSGALQRNLKCIADIFLGRSNLHRLTILVKNTGTIPEDLNQTITYMHNQNTPVYRELYKRGATLAALKGDAIEHIMRYSCQAPWTMPSPIYQIEASGGRIRAYVEDILGYSLKDSVDAQASQNKSIEALKKSEEETARYKAEHEKCRAELLQLDGIRQKLEKEVTYHRTECKRLTQLHAEQLQTIQFMMNQRPHDHEIAISPLAQRLRQTEAEYASLRSQVQLHNNYEQGDISRDLANINNMIEHLGQSMSEDLFDRYIEPEFGEQADDVTTLYAHDLPALKRKFGHQEGSPSLVASNGTGINIENFINFSIRARICHFLIKYIFDPFHPFIDAVESSQYATTYKRIQRNEQQYTAGRWRSITFNSIHFPSGPTLKQMIDTLGSKLLSKILDPLVKYFFGWSTGQIDVRTQEFVKHHASLKEIITTAWEWSSKVKGEVVMLGDFQPTTLNGLAGSMHTRFDPGEMQDFEANAQKRRPMFALCALGLGLDSYQAKGGGEPPEKMIVSKVTVLTDNFYHDL